ncbi:nitrous oxide reductase family maturation protein NosD [Streptomyces sp. TLI_171]|uniref:right-handed parallel beta-helix repeat-containing protein n=1 Tax=Streptomyces sp. TLI_171 TaxID=1938859 RepID=UPI000C175AED|nr:right-handed parallel beta-helix repeat-containing protein [Streptomyces sp. TLI_171]RKE23215.1 parallel beta helix pectate lyase-like protein [Streptomyces sp. TLI_171]
MTALFAPARPRTRLAAVLLSCACTVPALLAVAPAAAAPTGPSVHRVAPGSSVQAAVDAARPGDVVELAAGSYPGSVTLTTDRVTLRGQGARTVLVPDPADRSACAAAGNGLCVSGSSDAQGAPVRRLSGVLVEGLAVAGFAHNGITAAVTDGLTVRQVVARENGLQGISVEMSTRTVLTDNEARDNGQAGIFVANWYDRKGGALDTLGTEVSANRLTGNRIGLQLRRVRDLTVQANLASGNCGGVFVVGDDGVPRAGALTVRDNVVRANNRYCPPNPRLDFVQGTGILLTGTEDVTVTGNQISDHTGASPMSGGIVLYPSVVGAPNARATVTGNALRDDLPADLADRDPKGTGNVFTDNACRTSEPSGHC